MAVRMKRTPRTVGRVTVVAAVLVSASMLMLLPAAGQDVSPPVRPARPTVSTVAHDSVTITWTDPGDAGITGYQILRRNRATDPVRVFTVIADDVDAAATSYTDTSVEPETPYNYRIKARNTAGLSDWSGFAKVTTLAAPTFDRAVKPDVEPAVERAVEPAVAPTEDAPRANLTDLGSLNQSLAKHAVAGTLAGANTDVDRYKFVLLGEFSVELVLRDQDVDADLVLEDEDGTALVESRVSGAGHESILKRLEAGTYYVRVEAQEAGANSYELTYEVLLNSGPAELLYINRSFKGNGGPTAGSWVGGSRNRFDYFKFQLTDTRRVRFHLTRHAADLDLFLEDQAGTVIDSSRRDGTYDESITATLGPGTWYVKVEPQVSGRNVSYSMYHGTVADEAPSACTSPPEEPAGGHAVGTYPATVRAATWTTSDLDPEQTVPTAVWSDGETMWVADDAFRDKIFAYDFLSRERLPHRDINGLDDANNDNPAGLWSDGEILWVSDWGSAKIFAYSLATCDRLPERDFDTLIPADNRQPMDIWSDGSTMWVVDSRRIKVFAYSLATGERRPSLDLHWLPERYWESGWSEDSWFYDFYGLWSDGTTMWVADQKRGADTKTTGAMHAYDLATATWQEERSFPGHYANRKFGGMWSDGTFLWVADRDRLRIFAYDMRGRVASG